jgi:threonine synthase
MQCINVYKHLEKEYQAMKYFSTNRKSEVVGFREAAIRGQAPDKGLYFPEHIPQVDPELVSGIEDLDDTEIAYQVMQPFIGDAIPGNVLRNIVHETINFPIPLVKVTDEIYSLELFRGPTLAFKDVGARFMSRCLGHFLAGENKKVTVLVATSGDTGGAVANGFYDVPGIEVVILYPSGKVSPVQEKQLTTLGKNIHALEVRGTFDDCQQMVKQAFTDKDLHEKLFLTSANSINVARWLPQQLYYFLAYKQWPDKSQPPVISVPSGNFGNICAGILAHQTGLPVKHFIAACNVNNIVSDYLENGNLQPKKAVPTLSNAMDVGNPSNFIRIIELFHHSFPDLKSKLSSTTISDKITLDTIRTVFEKYQYMLDPHGAVGFVSLARYLEQHPGKGFFLETAHPVKFPDAVEQATGQQIAIPAALAGMMTAEKSAIHMEPEAGLLKAFLMDM